MIVLWSGNMCNNWGKSQGIREIPRRFQGLHVFPDINLRSWGLHEIPNMYTIS